MSKYLIFDTGALINLTQNGLSPILSELLEAFRGDFLIPYAVKYEAIEHPLKIKRFEWGAIRIQELLDENLIKLADDEKLVSEKEINEKAEEVMSLANSTIFSEKKPIHLIERGEAECLALSILLKDRGIENAVVIDERTARMLCENVDNLKDIMESKLEATLDIRKENAQIFKGIKVLRSTEMVYMAFKEGIIDADRKKLEAILYALKFGGCSISENEIQIMKKLAS